MKILFLTPGCFDKGGISRYSRYQILALRDLFGDDHVRVLSLLGPQVGDFETPFVVHWHGRGNQIWQKLRFVTQVLLQMLIWRPRVVHIAHVNFSGMGYVLARLFGVRHVVLNVYGLEVWSGLRRDASYGLRKVHRILSDCHFTARYLVEAGVRSAEDISVIWDCVDIDRFRPVPEQWEAVQRKYALPDRRQHFVLLTLGRLAFEAAHKGYQRLIEVFRMLADAHPHARLVIAGKGNMRPHLETLVHEAGLSDSVSFAGMVHEEDLPALYGYAHAFSLVSDRGHGRGEGIPLTPLEAMACGVPIVVGNQDGSQEAVVDGRNGYVVDPFDLKAHAEVLKGLMEDAALQQSLAREAISVAREVFAYPDFREKHRAFYAQLQC